MNSSTSARARTLPLAFAAFAAVAVAVSAWLAGQCGLGVFRALASLALWGVPMALLAIVPVLRFRLRPVLVAMAVVIPAAWLWWPRPGLITGATEATLQLAAIALAILAFALHFLATYGAQVARETAQPVLAALVPFGRLLGAAHGLAAGAVLLRLYVQRQWLSAVEQLLLAILLTLAAEALLRAVFRFYQPRRLRAYGAVPGKSVLLPALFGEAGPFRSLVATIEKNLGLRLADAWLVRRARALVAPLVLLGLLGLWASTAVTRVPVDSSGVHVICGEFQPVALPPGLHCHAPWPWGGVIPVPTGRVQEIALGFERDLAGPVLWAEKHFEGEQNLLVGQGEELLTINVPVQYRIRDAVASLRHSADPAGALTSLGYRQLLAVAAEHSAFGLMTTDRAEVAAKLQAGLQEASDRLGLGLEVLFVGLKDVHPPVPVAPAYQDVVSAEEEHSALIDQARSYAVQSLGSAQVDAYLARVQADTATTERAARAAGETSRFLAPLDTWRKNPGVFAARLRLEAIETALAGVRQLYVVPAGSSARRSFILGADAVSAAPLQPATNTR